MNSDDFRSAAHRVVDWLADYLESVDERQPVPDVTPGELRDQLPASAPAQGEPFEAWFDDFATQVVPGMAHWSHPGWFGYFPANVSYPSILAEMLVAGMGAQCMSWKTSPAATELEEVTLVWLREALGLPEAFVGVIQDTASTACLVAMISARERLDPGPGVSPDLVVYTSEESHSSVDKAVRLSGIGEENLRKVAADPATMALRADALERAIARDLDAGLRPCAVVATLGTTGCGGVDPLPQIAEICEKHGLWLHVDAAYAGSAAILPEKRWILEGVERADSFNFNPHKWLFTNFDCSAYYVRDPAHLVHTFSASPEYLRTDEDADVTNFRDWGIALGRRFRALKLWFVMRSYGIEGLRTELRRHVEWAGWFADQIRGDDRFELVGPTHFGLVTFRLRGDDAGNEELLRALNARGDVFLTHTRANGRYTLRVAIGAWMTKFEHVEALWNAVAKTAPLP